MAAAFARKLAPDDLEIVCAGDVRQSLHPMALQTMREIGENLEASGMRALKDIQYQPFDVVVTLCNHANEICPTFPGSPARIHWPLMDPAKSNSDKAEAYDAFKTVREEIRQRVESLFQHGFLRAMQQLRRTLGSILDNLTDGVLAHDSERRIFFFYSPGIIYSCV